MHRRGNKSKKVPNVRLRPAAADAMARARASPEPTSCWAEDSQIVGSDDTVMIGGSCPRPFRNVVVCATGVVDKPALFKLALELGATSVSAFTDRVTHLVAENHGGAKYQCALERKIPILLPSWITESHRIWQHGDDVDLAQSIASHRLPVFSGVTLCISGIPDIVQRTKINKALTAAGGTYVKNLERPIRVTHLLCSGEAETEKMRYAEKFNRAGEADPPIQLVWDEWFWDSLEYGGRFDEAAYHARLPRPEGRSTDAHPVPNSHPNAPSHAQTHVPSAFDEEEDEFAPIARVPAQTLQLWGSLLKARGYEVDRARGSVVLSPGKAREMVVRRDSASAGDFTAAEAQGAQVQRGAGAGGNGSLLSSFRRAQSNSMVVVPRDDPGAGPSRMPFGRSATTGNLGSGARSAAGPSRAKSLGQQRTMEAPHASADAPSTVFAGLRFLLRGETDTATVRDAIEKAGGAVVRGEDVDYIIVRLVSGSALYRADPSLSARARYRTECWLEQCACMDRVCAPDEHASFVPLGVPLPVPGADRITLSFSGLEVSEACWVRRLLKALGITLAPAFSRHSTHLLCPSGVGPKSVRARQWGVPVVDMGWLAAMTRTGAVPPVHAFLVAPAEGEDVPAPMPEVRSGKGKGKEREKVQEQDKERVDDPMQMQDITNSYDSQESPPRDREREGGFFLPPPPPARDTELVFGQPDASLGPPATPTPPKKQLLRRNTTGTPSRSRSRPTTPLALVAHAVPAPVLTQSSTASSTSASASASHSNGKGNGLVRRVTNPPGPVRRDTAAASTRRNPTTSSSPARVPSSTSPSPMRRGVSVSPPKIPDHRTKALQESIVSLLGKRPATPEESDVFAGRPGKRGRPHRSKPQSRQPSDALPVHAPVEEEPRSVFGARSLSPDPDGDGEGLSLMSGADEQSLRVMYEDPGQRAELRRLASLIGEPMEGEGAETRKRPRRSIRRGVS
ncbi:hypothetical protein DFH06DRAFT_1318411 [Mycena polygramma]|nr:hypothetical protein DFH06DRAFT_1318411 [Mycena polygramma]